MNERIFIAKESLEKERDELQAQLQNKMKEMFQLEDSLRNQLLNKGKRIKSDTGFDGLLRAFDFFDEV